MEVCVVLADVLLAVVEVSFVGVGGLGVVGSAVEVCCVDTEATIFQGAEN